MKSSLLILLPLIFSFNAFAQRAGSPRTITPESTLINDTTLTELTDLLGEPNFYCKKNVLSVSGTVGRLFVNDEGIIFAFQILDAKKKAHYFNLNTDPMGSVGKYSPETVKSVIRRKRKIKALYVECYELRTSEEPLNYITQITVQ